jgi:hypothetical protein
LAGTYGNEENRRVSKQTFIIGAKGRQDPARPLTRWEIIAAGTGHQSNIESQEEQKETKERGERRNRRRRGGQQE